jgi:hypothetical protein
MEESSIESFQNSFAHQNPRRNDGEPLTCCPHLSLQPRYEVCSLSCHNTHRSTSCWQLPKPSPLIAVCDEVRNYSQQRPVSWSGYGRNWHRRLHDTLPNTLRLDCDQVWSHDTELKANSSFSCDYVWMWHFLKVLTDRLSFANRRQSVKPRFRMSSSDPPQMHSF